MEETEVNKEILDRKILKDKKEIVSQIKEIKKEILTYRSVSWYCEEEESLRKITFFTKKGNLNRRAMKSFLKDMEEQIYIVYDKVPQDALKIGPSRMVYLALNVFYKVVQDRKKKRK